MSDESDAVTSLPQHGFQFTSQDLARGGFGNGIDENDTALQPLVGSHLSVDELGNVHLDGLVTGFPDNVRSWQFTSQVIRNAYYSYVQDR